MPASDYTLDIDKILASKFKGKKIPKVLVSALKKFFHIDFLNDILTSSSGEGVVLCRHAVECLDLRLEVSDFAYHMDSWTKSAPDSPR